MANKEESKKGNPPVFKSNRGNVEGTVWKNVNKTADGKTFETLTMNVAKNFQDKDGNWQKTTSFSPKEAMFLLLVIDDCLKVMTAPKSAKKSDSEDEE